MDTRSADALSVACADTAPMPRTTTNIKAENDLFVFISIATSQWLDRIIVQAAKSVRSVLRSEGRALALNAVAQTISIVQSSLRKACKVFCHVILKLAAPTLRHGNLRSPRLESLLSFGYMGISANLVQQ